MSGSTYIDRGRATPQNHKVYSEYLQCFTIDPADHKALTKRGLKPEQIRAAGYKSKPGNRASVAERAIAHVNSRLNLDEVPGFLIDDKGHRNHKGIRGLAIPSRDVEGHICSLVIRMDKPTKFDGKPINKYMAFSSAKDTKGGKVWQNTHCPILKGHPKDVAGDIIRVTEGVLKADVATALGKYYCLGFHGVNPHRDLSKVLSELQAETIHVAFDAGEDAPDVIRGRALTIKALREFGVDVRVEHWNPELGKGIDDVIQSGNEDKIEILTDEELEDMLSDANVRDPNNGDWVYVLADEKFYNLKTLRKLNKSQFRDKFGLMKVSKVDFLITEGFPQVDDVTFTPGKDQFIYEKDEKKFNLWCDPEIEPVKGDISPLLEHIEYLFPDPDEARHLMDWLAWCANNPGEKIFYAVLMKSEAEGVGKSWFGEMLRILLGLNNTCMLSSQMLNENFTGWAKKSCLGVVEEVWSAGKVEFMNKVKPLITQPHILIREMQREAYEIANRVNFFMTTNYSDAIRLAKKDRRYLVMVTEAEPKDKQYYIDLFDWAETDEAKSALMYYFSRQHKFTEGFNAKGKAPMTMAKRDLIEASRTRLEAWIEDCINDEVHPFNKDIICVRHLKEWEGCPRGLDTISDFKWNEAMKAAGAILWPNRVRLQNKSYVKLWIIRNHTLLLGKEGATSPVGIDTLITMYENGRDMAVEPGNNSNPIEDFEPL